ncbi:hypothetical protein BGX38DRAFT_1192844 [Terfezia claveryi]|nr:hypothetical protein BGX38DRAFT_1192844 [Terfezia claveryi]
MIFYNIKETVVPLTLVIIITYIGGRPGGGWSNKTKSKQSKNEFETKTRKSYKERRG